MTDLSPTLYLVSGKMAAGKSTFIKKLALQHKALLISQDDWLSALYPKEILSLEDYVKCSTRLASVMGNHISEVLKLGQSVALDFPANTLNQRAWMKSIADQAQIKAQLHFLDVSDDVCLNRLKLRNESGQHPYSTTEEQFHQFTKYFVAPGQNEGFQLVVHGSDS